MNKPIWNPKNPLENRMADFLQFVNRIHDIKALTYNDLHQWSITNPRLFWCSLIQFLNFKWDIPPVEILSDYQSMIDARWFQGAYFNFAQKLLIKNDDSAAIIYINEEGSRKSLSFRQLNLEVAKCAEGLKASGVIAGDRVVAVMPNSHYTVIAMLACTSLGAIWSSCSPDFGPQAIVDRLGQVKPKILFLCDGHQYNGKKFSSQEKLDTLKDNIPSLEKIVVCPNIGISLQINAANIQDWENFGKDSKKCDFVSLPFEHPLYILFSSGTTGKPKCIIHSAGGTLIQHLKELALHTNLHEQDRLCFYTTCGWMMWNWTVSALALGVTLVLYEGSPTAPDASALFKVLEQEQVTVFGTSAKYLSVVEKMGYKPSEHFKFPQLKCILATGSPLLPHQYDYVYQNIKSDLQLSSISGGTDIVSCFALGNPMLPVYAGELQSLGLGMDVKVFNQEGKSIKNQRGELVCTTPFPSMPIGFWDDSSTKSKYYQSYFNRYSNVWAHGDFAEISSNQGLIIYGRSDAVLNPGGVRIGTAEIYRQIESIEAISDAVVVAQNWEDDVRIILFVKLNPEYILDKKLEESIRQTIKTHASPRHVPAKILEVSDIPRTLNGKIVELAVRQTIHNQEIDNLSSIANPEALEQFKNRKELQV